MFSSSVHPAPIATPKIQDLSLPHGWLSQASSSTWTQIPCLSVVFTEQFFSYILLTSFLVKGKQGPEVKGCGGNSSVNVHVHFYTNQV